jgi:hypothetical protein
MACLGQMAGSIQQDAGIQRFKMLFVLLHHSKAWTARHTGRCAIVADMVGTPYTLVSLSYPIWVEDDYRAAMSTGVGVCFKVFWKSMRRIICGPMV